MKLTAGRESGRGERDGGVAEGLQVEAAVGVALQIQRSHDLRRRLLLLRARERHGLVGALPSAPAALIDGVLVALPLAFVPSRQMSDNNPVSFIRAADLPQGCTTA